MSRAISLILALILVGCSSPARPARDAYLVDVPDGAKPGEVKSSTRYAGACTTHGQFTNCSLDRAAVGRVVDAHNRQHHAGANDGDDWAKVYRCDGD